MTPDAPLHIAVVAPGPERSRRVAAAVRAAEPAAVVEEVGSPDGARARDLGAAAGCVVIDLPTEPAAAGELLAELGDLPAAVPVVTVSEGDDEPAATVGLRHGAQDHVALRGLSGPRMRRAIDHALERHAVQRARLARAFTDPLTGLPNRALFMDRLRHALARGLRGHAPVAVMFVDLDGFKEVNDTHGHAAGDEILEGFAHLLQSLLRPGDTVSRYGGDEFTVLCEDARSAEDVLAVARRIARMTACSRAPDGGEIVLRASVGVAFSTEPTTDARGLVARADGAMYEAKRTHARLVVSASPAGEGERASTSAGGPAPRRVGRAAPRKTPAEVRKFTGGREPAGG